MEPNSEPSQRCMIRASYIPVPDVTKALNIIEEDSIQAKTLHTVI